MLKQADLKLDYTSWMLRWLLVGVARRSLGDMRSLLGRMGRGLTASDEANG